MKHALMAIILLFAVSAYTDQRVDEYVARLSEQGREQFGLKHYEEAIGFLERIPEEHRTELDQSRLAWSHYFLFDPDSAIAEFRTVLDDDPESVDALCGAGWALHDMGYKELGAVLFSKALEVAPNYGPAIDGYNACTGESIKAGRSYGSIKYYGTVLGYSGDTPRTDGYVHDLQFEYGVVGVGYLNLMLTHSEIGSEQGFNAYRQSEIRPGGGFYAGGALWRGTVGYLSYDDLNDGKDTAWLGGVGVEYLKWKTDPFIDAYGYSSELAEAYQLVLGIAYELWQAELRTSLEFGYYNLDLRDDDSGVYFTQSVMWRPGQNQSLYGGFGVGQSYYGLRGAGGVFYSLPDKRLADAWLQWSVDVDPWMFGLGASYALFEGQTGGRYNSFGATLFVGFYWDGFADNDN